jgi:hypothetical protein
MEQSSSTIIVGPHDRNRGFVGWFEIEKGIIRQPLNAQKRVLHGKLYIELNATTTAYPSLPRIAEGGPILFSLLHSFLPYELRESTRAILGISSSSSLDSTVFCTLI